MKKHHLILISLLICSLYWGYSILNLSSSEPIIKVSFGLTYLTILSLLIPIVSFNNHLSTANKIGWIVFGLILTPVLPLIYYLKYKNEIQRIIIDTNKKMKEGPESLGEFNSGSHR
ncbi:hypothetical protein [Ekhidna sp.]|uniref:hypothetical protein n=1 Tax=Ekhidna sp. TaxID=2608089 RepID=UPI003B5A61FE